MNARAFGLLAVSFGCAVLCRPAWGDVVLTAGRIEVVEPAEACGPVKFAVQETTNFLAQVLGAAIPVVRKPSEARVAVILGDTEWTREAGVDVEALPRDSFVVRTVGTNRLVIAGRDAKIVRYYDRGDYRGTPFVEHATSFGVYAFFERFADARFFFPGELGTILPRAGRIAIPETDWREGPDSPVRRYYNHQADGRWFDTNVAERVGKALNWARTRMSSEDIPCCHGSIRFDYVGRFKESHPEYFSLKADGGRWYAPTPDRPSNGLGHLCWTSAITNELFLDAKAYLTGQDASTRGLKAWGRNCQYGKYVDIMPNDALQYCLCPSCTAAKLPGPNYANDVIWKATAGIAQRLIDEGVPGFITQMSYNPYKDVPSFDLPTNVLVMVAVGGPFSLYDEASLRGQFARTKAWVAKTGHKVWHWTYPGKHGERAFKGVPDICPRAWGRFYKEMSPYSLGAFAESESERWFYHHLNYYVFGKVLWNVKTDVDALLGDYYARMYGPAADDVRRVFEMLEDMWLRRTMGRTVETDLGPVCAVPSVHELWTKIYTPAFIGEIRRIFKEGVAKVPRDSIECRRLRLVAQEIVQPLTEASRDYLESVAPAGELKRRAAHPEEVSVVADGDFDVKRRGRFFGKWYGDVEMDCLVTNTFVTCGKCVELVGDPDSPRAVMVGQYLPDLKPDTTYRLSFFLKTEDVKGPKGKGGAGVTINDARNNSFPERTSYSGTMDWTHCQFEFTTHPDTGRKHKPYIRLRLSRGCTGKAWFDGVRLTEVETRK